MTEPLGDFRVDWDRTQQSFTKLGSGRSATAPSHVSRLFNWTTFDSQGQPKRPGVKFRHMFYSKLDVPDHAEWQFEKPLGRGGYGAAALFRKRDASQNVVDEFALKVTDVMDRYRVHDSKKGLTKEAAIMAQLNEVGCPSILRLRQFKEHSYENFCRYYFEYANLGSLHDLKLKYEAWNMNFPEPFLWHVFWHLAQACWRFEESEFRSLKKNTFGKKLRKPYLLHNDIKLDNIFLRSAPDDDKVENMYPIPKVADFGLATIIDSETSNKARAAKLRPGVATWAPPELRAAQNRLHPSRYFFNEDTGEVEDDFGDDPRDQHRISSKANIWAIGAIMWVLTSHGQARGLSTIVNSILTGKRKLDDNWERTTNIIELDDFGAHANWAYHQDLLCLIQECTRLKPGRRPGAENLISAIEEHIYDMEETVSAARAKGGDDPTRVYFQTHEFKGLPPGDADLGPKRPAFWSSFADSLIWESPEVEFVCPPEAPTDVTLTEALRCPEPVIKDARRRWKAAIRRRDNPGTTPPPRSSPPTPAVANPETQEDEEQRREGPANVAPPPTLPPAESQEPRESSRGRKRRSDEMEQDVREDEEGSDGTGRPNKVPRTAARNRPSNVVAEGSRWGGKWRWWQDEPEQLKRPGIPNSGFEYLTTYIL